MRELTELFLHGAMRDFNCALLDVEYPVQSVSVSRFNWLTINLHSLLARSCVCHIEQ